MKLLFSILLFALLIAYVSSVPCICSCCKDVGCTSETMKAFEVNTCDACNYDECATRYPAKCPSSSEKGALMVTCGDPAQIAVMIAIIAGSSCLVCLFCCCIIGALITVIVCVVRAASNQKRETSDYQTLLQ